MAVSEPTHTTWLVPIRVDADGTLLVPCPGLDDAVLRVHWWSLWCARCGGVASEPIPGTRGIQHIEDLPHPAEAYEPLYTSIHVRAVEAGVDQTDIRFPADAAARLRSSG